MGAYYIFYGNFNNNLILSNYHFFFYPCDKYNEFIISFFGIRINSQRYYIYIHTYACIHVHVICSCCSNGEAESLYFCLVMEPIKKMKKWLNFSSVTSAHLFSEGTRRYNISQSCTYMLIRNFFPFRSSFVPLKKALTMKPVNSVVSIFCTYRNMV